MTRGVYLEPAAVARDPAYAAKLAAAGVSIFLLRPVQPGARGAGTGAGGRRGRPARRRGVAAGTWWGHGITAGGATMALPGGWQSLARRHLLGDYPAHEQQWPMWVSRRTGRRGHRRQSETARRSLGPARNLPDPRPVAPAGGHRRAVRECRRLAGAAAGSGLEGRRCRTRRHHCGAVRGAERPPRPDRGAGSPRPSRRRRWWRRGTVRVLVCTAWRAPAGRGDASPGHRTPGRRRPPDRREQRHRPARRRLERAALRRPRATGGLRATVARRSKPAASGGSENTLRNKLSCG